VIGPPRRLSRRALLERAALAAIPVAAACVGVTPPSPPPPSPTATASPKPNAGTLRILQWSHAIPAYDRYLDAWAAAWGAGAGLSVRIDRIPRADLFARAAFEAETSSGHDLVGHWNHAASRWFEESLVDLSDVCDEAARRSGGFIAPGEAIGRLNGTWRLYPNFFVPSVSVWRSDAWERIGSPAGPATWQSLGDAAPTLQAQGTPIGTAYSEAGAAEQTWRSLLWSFGAAEFTPDGRAVAIDSPATRAALELAKTLYGAGDPGLATWSDLDNIACLASGSCGWIADSIGAYRAVQEKSPERAARTVVGPTLAGPAARIASFQSEAYGIWRFSPNVDAAKQYLRDYSADFAGQLKASAGFNMPFLTSRLVKPIPVLAADPHLAGLQDVAGAIRALGYPGPPTKAAFDALNTHVLADLMSSYATGKKTKDQAIADATQRLGKSLQRFPS